MEDVSDIGGRELGIEKDGGGESRGRVEGLERADKGTRPDVRGRDTKLPLSETCRTPCWSSGCTTTSSR
eukprot:747599-Hanusia_phi.AAC.1